MKYISIVLLILLSILTLITLQLYNINRANATNQNQQIITTESPAITTTTALLPKTSNNNTTTQEAATPTTDIPIAESVYASQSITLPPTVKSFVWYIVDEAHENTDTSSRKKVSDLNPDYLPTNVVMSQGLV